MTEDQVRAIWKPSVTRKDDFPPALRCKYNTLGKRAVTCWTLEGSRIELDDPRDLRNYPCTAIIKPTGFWAMSQKECGVTYDVVSMLLGDSVAQCPFGLDEFEHVST